MSERLAGAAREVSPLARLQAGRVLVGTLLLVLVLLASNSWGVPFPLAPFLGVVGAAYLVSFVSYAWLRRGVVSRAFARVQVGVDLLLETALVHVTGGPFSVFTFVYLLTVMTASRVLGPWSSLQVAAGAALCHAGLLAGRLYGVVPAVGQGPIQRDLRFEASLSLLVALGGICASFIVAYVSAKLADRLRQAGQLAQRAQADLSNIKVLHEDIVESVASGLVTLDPVGRVVTANRMAGAIAGRLPADLTGRKWEEVFGQVPPFEQLVAEFDAETRVRRLEASVRRPGDVVVPVGLSLARLSRGQGPGGVVCSFQDLTEIRKMETQVRRADRLAAVGALAASLAHEIRNPLLAVAGSIEEIGRSLRPTGPDAILMGIALKESARLNTLLSEFLEYSGVRAVERRRVSVDELLAEVLHLLSYDPRTPAAVKMEAATSPPGLQATLDARQIHQALWNLCVNAVEAMPAGGRLLVTARLVEGPRARPVGERLLEIRVRDTGPGVPVEQRARIFEPFYSTKPGGFGLGLAIVHRIVHDHDGEIDLDPDPDWSTVFVITLRLRDGEGDS